MKEIRLCDDADYGKVIEVCKEKGFGIEMQSFYDPNLIDSKEFESLISEHCEVFKDFSNGKSLHAPFWDLNLGSKNKMIKDITMKIFQDAYKVAKKLGCSEMIVHNGFVPNTSFYDGWVRNATAFWKEFFADKDDSITIMLENQCEEDCELLRMEIDAVNDPRLKVCLDIGHANANSNMSLDDWIECLGDRIGYLHLHNNYGKKRGQPSYLNDAHLGLDDGNINIPEVLALLEKNCPNAIWAIECNLQYMENSIKVVEDFFES